MSTDPLSMSDSAISHQLSKRAGNFRIADKNYPVNPEPKCAWTSTSHLGWEYTISQSEQRRESLVRCLALLTPRGAAAKPV
jgi:hypothetical protein